MREHTQTLELMANLMRTKFLRQSGIVYCLSRRECEQASVRQQVVYL